MMKNYIAQIKILIALLVVLLVGCNEFDEPNTIYNPDRPATESPVISSVSPADYAKAGVRDITINGSNMVTDSDTTWVFIGGEPVVAKSISAEQIVVDRPIKYGEDLNISVVIPSALAPATVKQYGIEQPFEEWGDFQYVAYGLMSIESDLEDNLYVGTRREIIKLSNNGIDITTVGEYGSAFAKITSLRFGPGGKLYAAILKNEVYSIDINTGQETEYADIKKKTKIIEFDANGNMFAGWKYGLFLVDQNGNVTSTGKYDGETFVELRVIEDYLYVCTRYFIYRNKILDANGTLGDDEVVLDLNSKPGFEFAELSYMTFDNKGLFVLTILGVENYSLFVYEDNGEITPYYTANILPGSIDQVIYGNDRYLYLNRGNTVPRDSVRLYKMGMENNGMPYPGRTL